MVRIEDLLWMQIAGHDKIWSIADEDLERSTATKTSAVHFLRFELTAALAAELKAGADWHIGVQHPVYTYDLAVVGATRESLLKDLD
jgi:hypothetical protein